MSAYPVNTNYAASSNITVTNLQSLTASSTWVFGWESGAIDNTSVKYLDYLVSGFIKTGASGNAAGEIRIHIVGMMDDSTWPDVFDGTESTETVADTEFYDAICKLGAAIVTDTGNGDIYPFGPFSVAQLFGGRCPAKFVIFISQSTTAALASSGNQVTIKGTYDEVGSAAA